MAAFLTRERLQPYLLDRLVDDEPENQIPSRLEPLRSPDAIKQSIERDLCFLLNATSFHPEEDLADYPQIATSVLNFGVKELSGKTTSGIRKGTVSKNVIRALAIFEPRLIQSTLRVHIELVEKEMGRKAVTVAIQGEIWSDSRPLPFAMTLDLDLETGIGRLTNE